MLTNIDTSQIRFTTAGSTYSDIENACAQNENASFVELGKSEQGRPIYGAIVGSGPRNVTLIAGAHSDEPVGPETLRTLILHALASPDDLRETLKQFTFIIIPHINPDGEARNQVWIRQWSRVEAYIEHTFRELPGRDVEFGYPAMRQENRLVSDFIKRYAPISMHMSLHGMGFSDGVMLLIEKHWIERTKMLQEHFAREAEALGLSLHDHDRKGEKGFQYIGPGFTTTPEGTAMKAYFNALGDTDTAAKFHSSSMEFVRSLGGDPLALVTELPLFLIRKQVDSKQPGVPQAYLEWKNRLPDLRLKVINGESIGEHLNEFKVQPLDLGLQIKLQLHALELGLETILDDTPDSK